MLMFSNIPEGDRINRNRITKIVLESLPTQRYRRQAVRNNLNLVGEFSLTSLVSQFSRFKLIVTSNRFTAVSVGGVLGLFLGVSILSAAEFVYFFTVRIFDSR